MANMSLPEHIGLYGLTCVGYKDKGQIQNLGRVVQYQVGSCVDLYDELPFDVQQVESTH
jgi:hypothetical protein